MSAHLPLRQIKRLWLVLKTVVLVGAVAKGFVGGKAAAAKREDGAAAEAVGVALRVFYFDVPFHFEGAVFHHCDFYFFHGVSFFWQS